MNLDNGVHQKECSGVSMWKHKYDSDAFSYEIAIGNMLI